MKIIYHDHIAVLKDFEVTGPDDSIHPSISFPIPGPGKIGMEKLNATVQHDPLLLAETAILLQQRHLQPIPGCKFSCWCFDSELGRAHIYAMMKSPNSNYLRSGAVSVPICSNFSPKIFLTGDGDELWHGSNPNLARFRDPCLELGMNTIAASLSIGP